VEQVARLIRSKGVSVWFITQNPSDIPESVLSQIGNRVQHALRAYTPNEQKALRAAARSFRENEGFDTETALQELAVGEALVSVLDEDGVPGIVERANILPPRSSMKAVSAEKIAGVTAASPYAQKYSFEKDRHSAFEELRDIREQEEREEQRRIEAEEREKEMKKAARTRASSGGRKKQTPWEKTINTAATTIGREVGKKIARGLFDTFFKGW